MLTCTSVQVKYGNYLDEGLGAVADVNVSLVTRLILHITDTQLPVSLVCVKQKSQLLTDTFIGQHPSYPPWLK